MVVGRTFSPVIDDDIGGTCSMEAEDIGCDTGLTAVSHEEAKEQALVEHRARIGRAHLEVCAHHANL